MVKRSINSYGTITLPKELRDELGISGITTLMLDIRDGDDGEKEIVIRKSENLNDVLKKYSKLAELLSRIAENTVAIVWNGYLLSMTNGSKTDNFVNKGILINRAFNDKLKDMDTDGVISLKDNIRFLQDNRGSVVAYYRIAEVTDDRAYFILLRDEMSENTLDTHRYEIIADIIKNWG